MEAKRRGEGRKGRSEGEKGNDRVTDTERVEKSRKNSARGGSRWMLGLSGM